MEVRIIHFMPCMYVLMMQECLVFAGRILFTFHHLATLMDKCYVLCVIEDDLAACLCGLNF